MSKQVLERDSGPWHVHGKGEIMCEDFRLKAPNFINFANELVCSRYLRTQPFSAGRSGLRCACRTRPCQDSQETQPGGERSGCREPACALRPSFPWEWLFPRVSGVFKGKTNSTERLWESVKFIGDSDLKPGVIDAYSNYQNEEEEYLKCQ